MLDWFNIALIALIVGIVVAIVYSLRKTMAQIKASGVSGEDARQLAKRIRERQVKCPRCERISYALLGTGNQWKCNVCNQEFEGPDHLPPS